MHVVRTDHVNWVDSDYTTFANPYCNLFILGFYFIFRSSAVNQETSRFEQTAGLRKYRFGL